MAERLACPNCGTAGLAVGSSSISCEGCGYTAERAKRTPSETAKSYIAQAREAIQRVEKNGPTITPPEPAERNPR